MTLKTTQWTCDTCGKPITQPALGRLEWHASDGANGSTKCGKLRLVHHTPEAGRSCCYNEDQVYKEHGATVQSLMLTDFLGAGGLMEFLDRLAQGEFPPKELIEMIKRLHIPGYEQVREHLKEAIDEGVFEPNTAEGFPSQSQIKDVCDWLNAKKSA